MEGLHHGNAILFTTQTPSAMTDMVLNPSRARAAKSRNWVIAVNQLGMAWRRSRNVSEGLFEVVTTRNNW